MSGEEQTSPRGSMTFLEHLEELRYRLIRAAIAMIAGMVVCWFFREELRTFLEAPLYAAWASVPGLPEPSPLSFKSLMEPFVAYLKISAIGGLFVASPVVFYQLWKFISPGLYRKEKRMAVPFVLLSTFLFVLGSAGAYTYVFPIGFSFFLQFSSGGTVETLEAEVPAAVQPKGPMGKGAEDETEESGAGAPVSGDGDWYQWLERHLFGDSCGEFVAARKGPAVRLNFTWEESRCGEPPEIMPLRRNGEELNLTMVPGKGEDGVRVFTALDRPGPKTQQYAAEVVKRASRKLAPVLMVKDYLDFAIRLLLAFGLVFELPILIFFLAYAGIVDAGQLVRFGRWFIVLSVVFAAILTPPDVVTQILLATPLVILYYLSVLVVYIVGRKKRE